MKKHSYKIYIIGVLLLALAVASLGMIATSYARFASQAEGTGLTRVALWGSGTDIESLNIDVSGLAPGREMEYNFELTNSVEGKVSQVEQAYSLTVETTGNLPLLYEIAEGVSTPTGKGTVITPKQLTFENGKAMAEGGVLPHTEKASHTYTLKVTWPSGEDIAEYADEIDLVTLTISAEQAMQEAG